jgi:hypothetical protein
MRWIGRQLTANLLDRWLPLECQKFCLMRCLRYFQELLISFVVPA